MKTTRQKIVIQESFYNLTPSKGVKKDTTSETVQGDSMSIKEMLLRHTQGIHDPTIEREGQYDNEDVNHDLDIEHRNKATELDLLEHISDNVPSKENIEATVKDLNIMHTKEPEPIEDPLDAPKKDQPPKLD